MLCTLYTIAILDKQDVCVMCNVFWKDEWNDEEE